MCLRSARIFLPSICGICDFKVGIQCLVLGHDEVGECGLKVGRGNCRSGHQVDRKGFQDQVGKRVSQSAVAMFNDSQREKSLSVIVRPSP